MTWIKSELSPFDTDRHSSNPHPRRIKPTKVAHGLGMLAKPQRKKLSDAEVKRRIGAMLKTQDEATKIR
ncbi:MAG: hypothetical protein ACTS6J_08930 [Burkholderiales bacterium]